MLLRERMLRSGTGMLLASCRQCLSRRWIWWFGCCNIGCSTGKTSGMSGIGYWILQHECVQFGKLGCCDISYPTGESGDYNTFNVQQDRGETGVL